MKIKDILDEEGKGFSLTNKTIDPVTGAISHKVVYEPIVDLRKEVEQLDDAFKRTLKGNTDPELDKFYEVYRKFKRQFKTHVNRKYGR